MQESHGATTIASTQTVGNVGMTFITQSQKREGQWGMAFASHASPLQHKTPRGGVSPEAYMENEVVWFGINEKTITLSKNDDVM